VFTISHIIEVMCSNIIKVLTFDTDEKLLLKWCQYWNWNWTEM